MFFQLQRKPALLKVPSQKQTRVSSEAGKATHALGGHWRLAPHLVSRMAREALRLRLKVSDLPTVRSVSGRNPATFETQFFVMSLKGEPCIYVSFGQHLKGTCSHPRFVGLDVSRGVQVELHLPSLVSLWPSFR